MHEILLVTLALCAIGYADPKAGDKRTVIRIPTTAIRRTEYNVAVKRLRAFSSPGPDEGMICVEARIVGFQNDWHKFKLMLFKSAKISFRWRVDLECRPVKNIYSFSVQP
jgi:hypothetical protein